MILTKDKLNEIQKIFLLEVMSEKKMSFHLFLSSWQKCQACFCSLYVACHRGKLKRNKRKSIDLCRLCIHFLLLPFNSFSSFLLHPLALSHPPTIRKQKYRKLYWHHRIILSCLNNMTMPHAISQKENQWERVSFINFFFFRGWP